MRGFMLGTVLILLTVLLVSGLAFLSSRALQARAASEGVYAQQALGLAEAGLEDARVKLQKDLFYPPPCSDEQSTFHYLEELPDPQSGARAFYQVTVDRSHAEPPFQVLVVTVEGVVGTRERPLGRRTLSAEFDLDPASATRGRYLRWTDRGSP